MLPLVAVASACTLAGIGLLLAWRRLGQARIPALTCALIAIAAVLYTTAVIRYNQTMLHLPDEGETSKATNFAGTIAGKIKMDGDRLSFVLKLPNGEDVQTFLYLASEEEREAAYVWGRGDRLQLAAGTLSRPDTARNEGLFDYREYLLRKRIHAVLRVDGLDAVTREAARFDPVSPHTAFLRVLDRLQAAMAVKLDQIYPPAWSGLMRSLLLGDRSELDPLQFDAFAALGLTHLIAISGLHIGIWLAIWYGLLRRLGMPEEWVRVCAFGLVPFYVLLTGASPSAVRAGCMALVGLWFWKKRSLRGGMTAIAWTACAMLIYDPYYLMDVGFQLSFAVTFSLIVAVPSLVRVLPLPGIGLRSFLAVSIVAQVASFPLVMYHFNGISLLSLPANLGIVPIFTGLVLPLGLASAALAIFWESGSQLLAFPVSRLLTFVFEAADWMAGVQSVLLVGASPSLAWMGIFWGTSACLLHLSLRKKPLPALLAGLSLLALVTFGFQAERWSREGWVEFIDVGQGDAALVRTPQGKAFLIDAGGTFRFGKQEAWRARRDPYETGKDLIVPLLRKRGIAKLDAVIATHGDHDHIGGMPAVLQRMKVGTLLFNGQVRQAESSKALFQTALEKQVPIKSVRAGHVLQADAQTELRILWPKEDVYRNNSENENSIVIWMRMGEATFLFTGDTGTVSETAWLSAFKGGELIPACEFRAECAVDVMKVGHHGSRHSTSHEWLQYWQPQHAVVSAGSRNAYGHPHPDTLGRLASAEARIWRTDRQGGIRIVVKQGGRELQVRPTLTPIS
ncbi:ComE operon protein 3 [Xylanibacillus composti]|uniref:ComE operon protein 3 n=2 Tax=Xylanibacillus composti TaxID=1572762 RepID=A0A8J4M2I7_9BACL|nr:ComE operon protein 3 [Xylanibacillus composti]